MIPGSDTELNGLVWTYVWQLGIMITILWVPGVNTFFGNSPPPAIALVPNLVFAVLLFVSSEYMKFCRRKNPRAFWYFQF